MQRSMRGGEDQHQVKTKAYRVFISVFVFIKLTWCDCCGGYLTGTLTAQGSHAERFNRTDLENKQDFILYTS